MVHSGVSTWKLKAIDMVRASLSTRVFVHASMLKQTQNGSFLRAAEAVIPTICF